MRSFLSSTVNGGWDPEISARRQVRLPELSAGQARRKEYFYPTAAEVQARVDKLRERQRRLEVKQVDLTKVRDELLPKARKEYEYVLEDSRHPFNRATCKPEDLRRAREEAKSEVTRLSKEAKRREGDVATAARALRESPSTVDGTLAEAAAPRRLLSARKLLRLQQQQQQQPETTAAATASVPARGPAAAEAAAATSTADGQVEEEDEEEEEFEEVEEGSEVEGAFDPNPELRSRLSDKSRSLRTNGGGGDAAEGEDEMAGGKTSAVGGGHAKGRIKAFGAVLEKTLSKTLLGRAPATAPGRTRKAGTSPRPQQRGSNAAAVAAAASWEPKSKHLRALLSTTAARSSSGSRLTGCPPPPPPPPPMLGMPPQIRARVGGGPQSGGGQPTAGMGGLLAEIRARGERVGGGGGGGGGTQSGGCQGAAGIGGLLAEIRAAKRG
ncbi:unnamed protein product [Ectocarpus sp. CCAP 1310/34]|nr:unnamed protein product [Ectocarpus sp. CCAP 1310/34]